MSRDQSYSLSATRPSYMKQSRRTCLNGLRASAWLRPEAPSSPWNTRARNTRSVSHTPPNLARSVRTSISQATAECNNSTTFPGIGLGAILSRCRLMTPPLLVAAVQALAAQAPALKEENKGTPQEVALLPDVTDVREISVHIAKAVIKKAIEEGLNQEKQIPKDDADLEEWIKEQMWDPVYRPLRKVSPEHASQHAKGEAGAASVRRQGSFSYH